MMKMPLIWFFIFVGLVALVIFSGGEWGVSPSEVSPVFIELAGSLMAITGTMLLLARVCGDSPPGRLVGPTALLLGAGTLGNYGAAAIALTLLLVGTIAINWLRSKSS
jgi:hypothetical protein